MDAFAQAKTDVIESVMAAAGTDILGAQASLPAGFPAMND
jgi:hypothetical protein